MRTKAILLLTLLILLFAAGSACGENDPLRAKYDELREKETALEITLVQDPLVALAKEYDQLGDYEDAPQRARDLIARADNIVSALYAAAELLISENSLTDATLLLNTFGDYGSEQVAAYYYKIALKYLETNKLAEFSFLFRQAAKDPFASELFLEPFYQKAGEFMTSAPLKAFRIYTLLGDYKNSAELANAAYAAAYPLPSQITPAPTSSPKVTPKVTPTPTPGKGGFHSAKVGDTITFGAYEQDNNKVNGPEPIQWRVLAKENNRLLVISRYGLDCRQFSKSYREWHKSSLRKWLNGDFISQAFTPEELKQIPITDIFTPATHNGTKGNTTQDRLFLLSTQEAERYFKSDADRLCKATAYTQKQGATTVDGDIGWWWLRSPGISEYSTVKVFTTGKIDYSGYNPNSTRGSIRPALWINLEP